MQNKKRAKCPFVILVPMTGLEPARSFPRGILSPLRLPVSPHRLEAPPRFELGMKVLQTSALPLGYGAIKITQDILSQLVLVVNHKMFKFWFNV